MIKAPFLSRLHCIDMIANYCIFNLSFLTSAHVFIHFLFHLSNTKYVTSLLFHFSNTKYVTSLLFHLSNTKYVTSPLLHFSNTKYVTSLLFHLSNTKYVTSLLIIPCNVSTNNNLQETKQKTKRILLEKLGSESVEWGHKNLGFSG